MGITQWIVKHTHVYRHLTRRVRWRAVTVCGVLLIAALLSACGSSNHANQATPDPTTFTESTQTPRTGLQTGLPGRASATPAKSTATPFILPIAPSTPVATPALIFPTSPPDTSPTPTLDCTQVFPIERIEAINFNTTTTAQLEAAFGRAESVSGRAPTYRFVARGCVLAVSTGGEIAQEALLSGYGTLDWLLDRYGPPAGVGISQGNLVFMIPGYAVLLFPDARAIAFFEALPGDLARDTPVYELHFRAPFTVDQQTRRLKLLMVEDWVPPLP
ncbi:MAG: hypothetical protein K8S97_06215 [Anaerolineae bacterium]|nr:hypothetical protein [Anaerolineae bacterium]